MDNDIDDNIEELLRFNRLFILQNHHIFNFYIS